VAISEGHHCLYLLEVKREFGEGALHVLNPLKAPKIRNMFVSAVASSTAVGTLETLMSWAVQAWTSI
jgi:hypothetical protein